MKNTNYTKIAATYDASSKRHIINRDPIIELLTDTKIPIRILDLGCGTGNYLAHQQESFAKEQIEWYGIDKSAEMLQVAKNKLQDVHFTNVAAEELPFEDSFFDYIVCNHAYHHFIDKTRAFDHVKRCLKPYGHFAINSIYPPYMKNSWIYHYFPQAFERDKERFLSKEALYTFFSRAKGFKTYLDIHATVKEVSLSYVHEEASLRNYSQLDVVDDDVYKSGLHQIAHAKSKNTEQVFDYAKIFLLAVKTKNPS